MNGFWEAGLTVYTAVIVVANIRVYLISHWTKFYFVELTIFISVGIYFLIVYILNDMHEVPLLSDQIYRGAFSRTFLNIVMGQVFILIIFLTSIMDLADTRWFSNEFPMHNNLHF